MVEENHEPLGSVLKEKLKVHSHFFVMLLARDLVVLLPSLVRMCDLDACVYVGSGAKPTLEACTKGVLGSSDMARLNALHGSASSLRGT